MTKARILIADDHPLFRKGLRESLSNIPFIQRIAEAGSGKEVLHILKRQKYDIVLMDIQMPEMDGIEATKEIKLSYPKTQVIALTTFDDSNYVKEMKTCGAKGFLLKTALADEISTAIQEVMIGNYYYSEKVINHESLNKIFKEQDAISDNAPKSELSSREIEIIKMIAKGKETDEIAELLFLSILTVRKHVQNIYRKLGISSNAKLIIYAVNKGWVKQ